MSTVRASYACVLVIYFNFLLTSSALVTHTTTTLKFSFCLGNVLHRAQQGLTNSSERNICSASKGILTFAAFPYSRPYPFHSRTSTSSTHMWGPHAFFQIRHKLSVFSPIPGTEPTWWSGNSSLLSKFFYHYYNSIKIHFSLEMIQLKPLDKGSPIRCRPSPLITFVARIPLILAFNIWEFR